MGRCSDAELERAKRYRESHKEARAIYMKKWRQEHKKEIQEYNKEYQPKYREKNKARLAEQKRKYREENRENVTAGIRRWKREHKKEVSDWCKRDYIKNLPKHKARTAVSHAIRDGHMVRKPCEICGKEPAEAHHDDYNKPLDVRWLCKKHHTEWHINNKFNRKEI